MRILVFTGHLTCHHFDDIITLDSVIVTSFIVNRKLREGEREEEERERG